jgi:class 3 adenylate cyclase
MVDHWGQGRVLDYFGPSRAADPAARAWAAAFERSSASPAMVRQVLSATLALDVKPVLASVSAPTLVLHHRDEFVPVEKGRELADGIAGARYVEIPGGDHTPWGEGVDTLLPILLEFVTGRPVVADVERALATVLVTDIVGSTKRAAEVGDRRWKQLLAEHDSIVRRQLGRFDGHEVNTTGDGFVATFDRPSGALYCATAASDSLARAGLPVRAGVHTGEVEVAGTETRGIALHIATRVASEAGAGEILASSTVRDLVIGSELSFEDRGTHELKGVPGEWRLYAVTPAHAIAANA